MCNVLSLNNPFYPQVIKIYPMLILQTWDPFFCFLKIITIIFLYDLSSDIILNLIRYSTKFSSISLGDCLLGNLNTTSNLCNFSYLHLFFLYNVLVIYLSLFPPLYLYKTTTTTRFYYCRTCLFFSVSPLRIISTFIRISTKHINFRITLSGFMKKHLKFPLKLQWIYRLAWSELQLVLSLHKCS